MKPLVQRLGYVALNVTNLRMAIDDAKNILGVNLVEDSKHTALLTSNQRHAELVLYQSDSNRVRCIGLQAVNPDAVDEIKQRVKSAGLRIISEKPSLSCIEKAVTFATTEGHIIEVHEAMPRDRPLRYLGAGIHPRCVDHVNLAAEQPEQICKELERAIGLQLVERTSGDEIFWMRAADNRHHTVAVLKARTGLHHLSWEFSCFEDLKRLGDALDADDRTLVWGPGRHGPGDNLFAYYFDRAGFIVECIAEMEVIYEEDFQPRVSDLSNIKVANRWGALPPQVWLEHHNEFAVPE